MIAPLTREDIESELAPIVGMHVAHRASFRIIKHVAPTGPFDMACFGCDSGRHETRQYCPSCEEVTDSYPSAGGVA